MLTPPLTTIRFDYKETGNLATDTIIKLINQDEILQEKFVKFDFIKGETVKKLK